MPQAEFGYDDPNWLIWTRLPTSLYHEKEIIYLRDLIQHNETGSVERKVKVMYKFMIVIEKTETRYSAYSPDLRLRLKFKSI